MNGKQTKRLRRLARTLGLPEATEYAPTGETQHFITLKDENNTKFMLPRPLALKACERRGYHEAKKIFLGKV